jgi:ribonuclease D
MPTTPFDLPFSIVDSAESLEAALPVWFAADLLAVDIECSLTGIHHCTLALLQVADHEQVWLVDPITLGELARPALEALAKVPWICHDFSNDGIVMKRLYDIVPGSVLDTMLLARALGYPQPGLKTMSKLKLGIEIPKEEQDSNWMLRPLRESQLEYAARDAALLLPLLRRLAEEAEVKKAEDPAAAARLLNLPKELRALFRRIRAYKQPDHDPVVAKARSFGEVAEARARALTHMRATWGNEGDIGAIMDMGNRWILARVEHPPRTKEALERTIPNPRFRRKRLDALWALFKDDAAPKKAGSEEDDLLFTS